MITKTKVQQLEKRLTNAKNSKEGRSIVVKRDTYGRWSSLEGRLLTKKEVDAINEERKNTNKILILVDCWEAIQDLPKDLPQYGLR